MVYMFGMKDDHIIRYSDTSYRNLGVVVVHMFVVEEEYIIGYGGLYVWGGLGSHRRWTTPMISNETVGDIRDRS